MLCEGEMHTMLPTPDHTPMHLHRGQLLKIKNPNDYTRVQSAPYQHLEITIYLLMATLSSTSSIRNTVRDHSTA